MVDQIFVLALAGIAAKVACGLADEKNMWRWIISYWVVLTAKNAVAFLMEVLAW